MQDGVLLPFLFQLGDGKPLKQFALAFEVGVERGEQQALAEAAGAGQEIITSCRSLFIDQCSLVYIQIAVLAKTLETLNADGKVLKCHCHCIWFYNSKDINSLRINHE